MQNLHNTEIDEKRFDFLDKKTRLKCGGLCRSQLKTQPEPVWL